MRTPELTMKVILVLILLVLSAGAYAQFNKCGSGFCPGGAFGPGFATSGSSITPPACSPGNATGEMDFSVCSNIAITAALW